MPPTRCPECGVLLNPGDANCWLCHALPPTLVAADVVRRAGLGELDDTHAATGGRFQFGLSSILLFVTLFAILCSIIKMSPGLGIPLAILAAPALLRTCVVALRQSARGKSMSAGEKTQLFVLSIFMVFLVAVAAIIAFCVAAAAICAFAVPMGPGSGNQTLVMVLGIAAGLAVGVLVAWSLWNLFTKL